MKQTLVYFGRAAFSLVMGLFGILCIFYFLKEASWLSQGVSAWMSHSAWPASSPIVVGSGEGFIPAVMFVCDIVALLVLLFITYITVFREDNDWQDRAIGGAVFLSIPITMPILPMVVFVVGIISFAKEVVLSAKQPRPKHTGDMCC